MTNPNLPARMFSGRLARQGLPTAREVGAIHGEIFVERARAAAERDLAILKISDIAHVGRHTIAEAGDIAACVTAQIEANPVSARPVSQIAETTIRGMER